MSINIGLCGLGNMGQKHKSTIERNSRCSLAAIYDPGIKEYANWKTFSESLKSLDGVIVACPSEYHVDMCQKIINIQPDIKILLEKPISNSLEDALILQKYDHNILIGQVERFNPAVIAMKREWESNKPGAIFSIQTRRYSYPNRPLKKENCDVATDLLVHDIDAVKYIFNTSLQKVKTFSKTIEDGFREIYNIEMVTPLRAYVSCCSNWLTPKSVRDMTIICENGMYVLDYMNQSLGLYTTHNGQQVRKKVYFSPEHKFPLDAELSHFIDMIVHDVPPSCNTTDAIDTLNILLGDNE